MNNLKNTALSFLDVFKNDLSPETLKKMEPFERARMKYLAGLIALDAQVAAVWKWEFAPDWENIATLIHAAKSQSRHLRKTLSHLGLENRRALFFSSLSFILNTKDTESFAPNFTDFAVILAIRYPDNALKLDLAKELIHLQHLRNACIHTGKKFQPEMGQELQQRLSKCFSIMSKIHPAFSPTHPELDVLKAA
jgi:hypothetical protein